MDMSKVMAVVVIIAPVFCGAITVMCLAQMLSVKGFAIL